MSILSKILTLFRGAATEAGQSIVDQNAVRILDQEIRKILSHRVSLVDYGKRRFCDCPDAPEAQLTKQGTLVNFLEEPYSQRVGDLEYCA